MKARDLFELNIKRAERLLDFHKNIYPVGRPSPGPDGDDLLRAVIVFATSALDAYMHMRIVQVVSEIIYKKKSIPEKCITYIEREFKKEDRSREFLKIAIVPNSNQKIVQLLKKGIAGITFQKSEQLQIAFEMMGVKQPWERLDNFLISGRGRKVKGKRSSYRKFLDDLSGRRDDIVHEGDVYIGPKYHGKLKPITRTWTKNSLTNLKKLVYGIEYMSTTQQ